MQPVLGNPMRVREDLWQQNTLTVIDSLWRDLKFGWRSLRRSPGFSVMAVLIIMGLGIGVNAALFTVVRSVLLRPLPFRDQGRLVQLFEVDGRGGIIDSIVAAGDFGLWQKQTRSFEQMAILGWTGYDLSGKDGQLPELVSAVESSWNLFSTLGVQPALGRSFVASDDRREAGATVMLTWGLWKRRFNGDPNIPGQQVSLDGKPYTVIGVLPEWFTWPNTRVQMWTPMYHEESPEQMQSHISHSFNAIARLKPGTTVQEARADLDTVQRQIHSAIPDGSVNHAANVLPIVYSETHGIRTALFILLGATGCLLLIACLNVANLMVARATARQREVAIRTALGGSRARRLRAQLIESLLLCISGGLLGLMLAFGAIRWLVSVRHDLPRADSIHVDGTVLLFVLGVVLLSSLLSGILPALISNDKQALRALQESSRSHSSSRVRVRVRRALMTLELGLTVVLLISAGLLIKSYNRLRSVDLGCTTHNVLTMDFYLPPGRYSTRAQVTGFYASVLERVRQLPGVQGAGLVSTGLPGTGFHGDDSFSIQEDPPLPKGQTLGASIRYVDPEFFHALQIPLIRGRTFLPQERLEQAQIVVVNEAFVRRFFPGRDPIGKHIMDNNDGPQNRYEIVGVAGDTLESVAENPKPTMYYPLYRGGKPYVYMAVHSGQDPSSLVLPIQRMISKIDPDLPLSDVMTMDQLIGKQTLEQSFNATLLLVFAALSLILASVGLFGVLSYIIAQRTTEIGIRIALGARRQQVLWLMMSDGLRPAILGLVLGLVASTGATRLIQSMLYATHPLDPLVFAGVTVTLLSVAILACLVPAWNASRLDPIRALRSE